MSQPSQLTWTPQAADLARATLQDWKGGFLIQNADNLPANTRYCMELQGRHGGVPRPPMPATSDQQKGPIREALAAAGLVYPSVA